MTQSLSSWRRHSREIIDATLAQLPPGATRKDAEKALRVASPYKGRFSGDGLSWGSQCWWRERRVALARRFPDEWRESHVIVTAKGIDCTWCLPTGGVGCMACFRARDFLATLPPEGCALLAAADADASVRGPWCDWLEDHDRGDWAAQWRNES